MIDDFPFVTGTRAGDSESLPKFKEYAWDFYNDSFKLDGNGQMILLEGDEALKVWIIKTLRTERYRHLAYSWRYGLSMYKLINKVMAVGERRSELRRYITESLMANPYIKAVKSIEFVETNHGRNLEINILINTIYGEIAI